MLTSLTFIEHEFGQYETSVSVNAADFDSDGDMDLLVGIPTEVQVYTNQEGNFDLVQTLPLPPTITRETGEMFWVGVHRIDVTDADGDGELDLLVHEGDSLDKFRVQWFENLDGMGTYADSQIMFDGSVRDVTSGDVDEDGNLEFAVIHGNDSSNLALSILAFDDGRWTEIQLQDGSDGWIEDQVFLVDIDGDGDLELLSRHSGRIGDVVIIRDDLNVEAGSAREIADAPRVVDIGDVDSDGDLDIAGDLSIFENVDGGTFVERAWSVGNDLPQREEHGDHTIQIVDLDGDGDLDSLETRTRGRWFVGELVWYENLDGRGELWSEQTLVTDNVWFPEPNIVDLDSDGDLDVLSPQFNRATGQWRIAWYESRIAGDADDNGDVDFADFLALSANFGATDAAWADGDFTMDGLVTFEDFLVLSSNFSSADSV